MWRRLKNTASQGALLMVLLLAQPCFGQDADLKLPNGVQKLRSSARFLPGPEMEKARFMDRYFFVARLSRLPNAAERTAWAAEGLNIGSRLTDRDFFVNLSQLPDAAWLKKHGISHLAVADAAIKLNPALQQQKIPAYAKTSAGKVQLLVFLQQHASPREVANWLSSRAMSAAANVSGAPRSIKLTLFEKDINELAQQPFVEFIQPVNRPDYALNQNGRSASRAFSLNAPLASGGRNLSGRGIVAGVGDDADPSLHPDLSDRIINRTGGIVNNHGTHTSGTIAGAGIMQDIYKGYAPQAAILSQFFGGIWENAATYVQDFDMAVTNNSYANTAGDCYYNGVYDVYSSILDQQAQSLPALLHVFAAGNSGDDRCSPYPGNYGTILGSYQSAKNILCVGRADLVQVASQGSSLGPVKDGRVKPDLCVLGDLTSTWGSDDYSSQMGTSMSAPGVTGGLVLLNERYRQLNGTKPRGDLLKNLLMNGARDIGQPGPDYKAGFGLMNLERSLAMMEDRHYFSGVLAHGESLSTGRQVVLSVPPGLAALKVMLYWHDVAASPLASKTLVNDLDLAVISPSGGFIYPKILNPSPSGVSSAATEGPDHTNNVEQVVLLNPAAGDYTVRLNGFSVLGSLSQAYTITYDYVPVGLSFSVPFAGDSWEAGASIPLAWNDEGTPAGSYTLEYSVDNGASWIVYETGIPGTERFRHLSFPDGTATTTALVRIRKSGGAGAATTAPFTVIGNPVHALAPQNEQCRGYIKINWQAVAGADDYEVLMKQGPQMVGRGITAGLSFTLGGLSPDSTYYLAVRARKAGKTGHYRYALIRQPNTGGCSNGISAGDLAVDSITNPRDGRQFTASALGSAENIQVRIRNLDNAAVTAFTLQYGINGGPLTTIPVAATIPGNGSYTHAISGINLAAPGQYQIIVIVKNTSAADLVPANDTLRRVIKQLANPPMLLSATPTVESFEACDSLAFNRPAMGMAGLDRWDYANNDIYARARTFVNTGFSKTGNRAITLDVSKSVPFVVDPANYLTGNFNLSTYNTSQDLRLDFAFNQHGSAQGPHPLNKVWIRGHETAPWLEVYDLGQKQSPNAGEWVNSPSIELSDLLEAAGQAYSASTQVRFGQWAQYGMADLTHLAGYSFDDIRLYLATNDVQLLAIDTPGIYSCGLNAAVPVRILVKNSMHQTLTNIPVAYRINGGGWVQEQIAGIPGNTELNFEFATKANMLAEGSYLIEAVVNMPGDNVPDNNGASARISNQRVISSFPYLERFENGTGGYYANGKRSSWEFGTPASLRINKAASGANAWKTTLAGTYNALEVSYLNSPCFDLTGLDNPTLSFSMAYDLEDCSAYGVRCDAAWVEYSKDGKIWEKLGFAGSGTNWYDNVYERAWLKRNQTHWHVATIPLPKNIKSLQFRFVMNADDYTNYEGIAIDDIHVYDLQLPIYTSAANSNTVSQTANGSGLVHFADGGKIIASVLTGGNNLGTTLVNAYMYGGGGVQGPVQVFYNQYYGQRNITIKPSANAAGPAKVRYYFTDAEVNALRAAGYCATCKTPADYTVLGITQYSNTDRALEDDKLNNNTGGAYAYRVPRDFITVPYDAGYYTEFEVNGFSEFWLNDGNIDPFLPMTWQSFTATRLAGNLARLSWVVQSGADALQYEVEAAAGDAALAAGDFVAAGTLLAKQLNSAAYSFDDPTPDRRGRVYYRIKQVSKNGSITYSALRMLDFGGNGISARVFPNPVKDRLLVKYNSPSGGLLRVQLLDGRGLVIYSKNMAVAGGDQLLGIPVAKLPPGVYMIALQSDAGKWTGKLVKE